MPSYPQALIRSYRLHGTQPLAFVHVYRTPENNFIGHFIPTLAGVALGLREFQTTPAASAEAVWHGYRIAEVDLYGQVTLCTEKPADACYEVMHPRGARHVYGVGLVYLLGLERLTNIKGWRLEELV